MLIQCDNMDSKHRFHPTSPSTARPSAAAPGPQSCPETNCHGEKRWETPGTATKLEVPRDPKEVEAPTCSRLLFDVPSVLLGLPKVFWQCFSEFAVLFLCFCVWCGCCFNVFLMFLGHDRSQRMQHCQHVCQSHSVPRPLLLENYVFVGNHPVGNKEWSH